MKKLSLILVVVFVAMATMSYAGIQPSPKTKSVTITLQQAAHIPGLGMAIRAQIDPNGLFSNNHTYTGTVVYRKVTYYVTGTRVQWLRFLRIKIEKDPGARAFKMGPR